ncbi:hypothetical protein SK128_000260 [Halocaridina rubra]|uniref:Uncharacterized protein n=1 Tax=Halocaridina rubra TaxID=373956 RepID=A0AAN8XIC8_HALRR
MSEKIKIGFIRSASCFFVSSLSQARTALVNCPFRLQIMTSTNNCCRRCLFLVELLILERE